MIYLMAAAFAFATMVKPAAAIFFWIAMAVIFVWRRQQYGPIVLYIAIMLAWTGFYWRYSMARPTLPPSDTFTQFLLTHPQTAFLGPPNSYVGYHFFAKFWRYHEFQDRDQGGLRQVFTKRDADRFDTTMPQEMAMPVAAYMMTYGPQIVSADCLHDFGGDIGSAALWVINKHDFMEHCTGSAMGWVYTALVTMLGEERAAELMLRTGLHYANSRTGAEILAADWLQSLLLTSGADSVGDFRGVAANANAALIGTVKSGEHTQLPPSLARHVGIMGDNPQWAINVRGLLEMQDEIFRRGKLVMFALLSLVTVVCVMMRRPSAPFVTFLFLAYVGSATLWVVAMIPPTGDPRHEALFTILPLLGVPLWLRR